jgi:predicted metal-dependent peptidase
MATPTPFTGELDYDLLDRQLDKTKAKVFLGNNAAFLGPLLCSLDFVWSEEIPTADTDGTRIRWNPRDFLGCTLEGRVSSLLHELGHVYRMHPLRRGDRCPDIWNIACDIAINRDLIQMGYSIEGWANPGIGPRPDIPFELEEEIYEFLKKPGGGGAKPPPGQHVCGGMPLNMTPAQKQHMINSVVQAIHSAKENKQPGAIPGHTEQIIKQFLAPKVPWEAVLQKWMTDLLEEDFTWARPNRRYGEKMYLPSRYEEDGRLEHLMFFEDVSGSISDADSRRFNSELKYVWDTFKPKKLTVVQFDTVIQKIDVFEEGDPFDEIKIVGRGGTCLVCVRDYIEEHKPTAAIIFSDLFVTPMEPLTNNIPVLWVAIANKDAKVKFGKLIHIRS